MLLPNPVNKNDAATYPNPFALIWPEDSWVHYFSSADAVGEALAINPTARVFDLGRRSGLWIERNN